MPLDKETLDLARKFAVKNAVDYGTAKEGPIIAKVLAKYPGLKAQMNELASSVSRIVKEVNSLARSELEAEYSRHAEEFEGIEKKKAELSSRHRFEVNGAESGKFATRFPPEPSGYMHIGHAKPLFIEDELRKRYSGKLFLYFDDTNPDNEKQEFVDAFKEDLRWLGIEFDRAYFASDNIPMLYDFARKAIAKGGAYVCTCSADEIKENRQEGLECRHKRQATEESMRLWEAMLLGNFGDGEAVLRWNGDMKAENTSLRDPTFFRIKRTPHYRQGSKYHVWPNYDFCTPIIDSTNGITDVVRSKEYEMRDQLYFSVLELLGLEKPRISSISRLEIANNLTSKRRIRELIAKKLISGWDDPRLVTIRALRRRGITAQAIRELALSSGMGKSESVYGIEALLNINRKIVSKSAKSLPFVENPVEMRVSGMPSGSSNGDYGNYKQNGELFINAMDGKILRKGDTVRLGGAFDVTIKDTGKAISAEYAGSGSVEGRERLHRLEWIAKDDAVKCELSLIGDLLNGEEFNAQSIKTIKGYADARASELEQGEIVQFSKLGYFKLDDRKTMSFISL
ncbi:MAG: glutamate--tRNA ligase [Candidatus Micrarchaeaceae archaeon]